jgi:hypothetical protein
VSPTQQQQQREKCLREVPGVAGAGFEIFCLRHQWTDLEKKTTAANCRKCGCTVRRIRTVPDGTEGGKNANCKTKPQQHNTGGLALEPTAVRMHRLAWSWSKLNNTTTTKSR